MASTLIYTAILLIAASTAYGLTCYKCDSSESSLCSYGFTRLTFSTVDCKDEGLLYKAGLNSCAKFVAKGNDGKEYVARGCVPLVGRACDGVFSTLNLFSGVDGGVKDVSCDTCTDDKCNSAPKMLGASLIGLILAAVAYLF